MCQSPAKTNCCTVTFLVEILKFVSTGYSETDKGLAGNVGPDFQKILGKIPSLA